MKEKKSTNDKDFKFKQIERKIIGLSGNPIFMDFDDIIFNLSYAYYEYLAQNALDFGKYIDFINLKSKHDVDNRYYRDLLQWLIDQNKLKSLPIKDISNIYVDLTMKIDSAFHTKNTSIGRKLIDDMTPTEFANKILLNSAIMESPSITKIYVMIEDDDGLFAHGVFNDKKNLITKFFKKDKITVLPYKADSQEKSIEKLSGLDNVVITDNLVLMEALAVSADDSIKYEFILPSRKYCKANSTFKTLIAEKGYTISYYKED